MQDPHVTAPQGGTHWRRFAALMVPTVAVAGTIIFGMANGALAASFAVSGQEFKVSASKLDGTGFVQYGGLASPVGARKGDKKDSKNIPVAVSGIADAKLFNLCQSVKTPNLPVVLTIHAGDDPAKPVRATNLMLDVTSLEGDATFEDIQIGRDAAELSKNPHDAGGFGQSARSVTITDLRQVAMSTSAGTFTLTGLRLKVHVGAAAAGKECF